MRPVRARMLEAAVKHTSVTCPSMRGGVAAKRGSKRLPPVGRRAARHRVCRPGRPVGGSRSVPTRNVLLGKIYENGGARTGLDEDGGQTGSVSRCWDLHSMRTSVGGALWNASGSVRAVADTMKSTMSSESSSPKIPASQTGSGGLAYASAASAAVAPTSTRAIAPRTFTPVRVSWRFSSVNHFARHPGQEATSVSMARR
jgi:hypothetical protein